jgi:hypothetical protein
MNKKTPEPPSDISSLEISLKIIIAVCGSVEKVVFSAHGDRTLLSAVVPGAEVSCVLDGINLGLDGDSAVSVAVSSLQSAIKGRKSGTLSLSEQQLKIRSGSYTATMPVAEAEPPAKILKPEGEDVKAFALTAPLQTWLQTVIPMVSVTKLHSTLSDPQLLVDITPTSRFVACFDRLQLCYKREHQSKDEASEPPLPTVRLELPYTEFLSLIKGLPEANAKCYVDGEFFVATAEKFRLRKTLPMLSEALSADDVFSMLRESAAAKPEHSLSVSFETIKAFMENSRSLASEGASARFKPAPKESTRLTVESSSGSTSLLMPKTGNAKEFSIDFTFLSTAVAKQTTSKATAPHLVFDVINDFSTLRISGAIGYIALLQADMTGDTVDAEESDD